MCGILGCYSSEFLSELDERLRAGLKALRHRGPDDRGLEIIPTSFGSLAFGQTRLSIIDLSPGGHQPMHSPDGRYTIVYNGEVYNYRELRHELRVMGRVFQTESDTEVLLAAWAQWDVRCLRRLIGMFAFAVFDRWEETLTLVRDAFGIKPLFFQHTAEGFYFASEIPALLKLLPKRPAINLQRTYDYLVFGSYDDQADTFYSGIRHLLPGHWLRIHLDEDPQMERRRWWWPDIKERRDLTFKDAVEQLREMFLRNVRLHLRSDVPLGAALSGGVDSSAVVCAMRHLEPDMPIHTFSFVVPGSKVNEESWADIVNRYVGAIPHKVVVAPHEFSEDLDDMIRLQGEPFGSTSIYAQYRVFRLAREHGITVTLDGQGADELLAGYIGYPQYHLRSLLERHRYLTMLRFLRAWLNWPGHSGTHAIKCLVSLFVPSVLRNIAYRTIGKNPKPAWLNLGPLTEQEVIMALRPDVRGAEAVGRRLAEALRSALSDSGLKSLLRHEDRNAMHWSIENRVPFLTIDLAEFLLSLPEEFLLSPQGQTKRLLRAAMRGLVPDAILDRRDKVGFETPERQWLAGQRARIDIWMEAAEQVPFLNAKVCRKEVETMLDGQRPFSFQAWRLINYCRWVQLQG